MLWTYRPHESKQRAVRNHRLFLINGWLLFLWLVSTVAHSGDVLVLYPEIRDPYRQVFLNIIDGINAARPDQVKTLILSESDKPADIQTWLDANAVDGIISLGKRSLNLVATVPRRPETVVGGVIIAPNEANLPGISLVSNPGVVLTHVKKLLPGVRRIYAAYQPQSADWLILLAKAAAKSQNVELVASPITDVRQMALKYREILQQMNPEDDVLWIAIDGASPDRQVLHNILEVSWRRNLRVISGNLSDVKKGVLFSFYPDNVEMGKALSNLLDMSRQNKAAKPELIPANSLLTAINMRTADHLKLTFSKEDRQEFGLMYPPPLER